eukprot:15474526-Alexandrium_andersonii.AAC.1
MPGTIGRRRIRKGRPAGGVAGGGGGGPPPGGGPSAGGQRPQPCRRRHRPRGHRGPQTRHQRDEAPRGQ